jgi:DNA-directed RNA polymerase specialized sigma24 family protein
MWLRYVEDQSIREVATALDKSMSWAKVTLMRGRRRLSDELAAGGPAALESESYG